MMKGIRPAWLLAAMIVICVPSLAQSGKADKKADENEPIYGIRISQRVLDGFLDQFVQRMERQYDLSPDQIRELQGVFRERVPKFLLENQKDFEKLANEFLDTINQDEAPTPEFVAQWSKRALPMVGKLHEFASQTAEAMKDHMADEQVVKLEATMAAMDVGVQLANKRLNDWAAGRYDPVTEWHRNPEAKKRNRDREREAERAMREAREAALRESGMDPGGRPRADVVSTPAGDVASAKSPMPGSAAKAPPKDEWAQYVDAFVARYALDIEQQQKAQTFLTQARDRKEKHLSAKTTEIEKLGKRFDDLKKQQDKDGLAAAEAQYKELMKPVDLAFEKLKENLESLPTRDQRAKAAAREMEKTDKPPAAVAEGGERAQEP